MNIEDKFQQLFSAETEDEGRGAEKSFLDKTKEALDSEFKANAWDIAAEFDEFRRRARDEESMPFYEGFFATLSELIPQKTPRTL